MDTSENTRRIKAFYTVKGVLGTAATVLRVHPQASEEDIKEHLKRMVQQEWTRIGASNTSALNGLVVWKVEEIH